MDEPTYLHLRPLEKPPDVAALRPFKAVVIVESNVTDEWRDQISDWLVGQGCLYMMAWGIDCSRWDDSVDLAAMKLFDFKDVPDDSFVMTTWHENEPLQEAFFYCRCVAYHPTLELNHVLIVHIADQGAESVMLAAFRDALENLDEGK